MEHGWCGSRREQQDLVGKEKGSRWNIRTKYGVYNNMVEDGMWYYFHKKKHKHRISPWVKALLLSLMT